MDWTLVFAQGDALLIAVFITLLLMSITSWWLILWRTIYLWRMRQQQRHLLTHFWHAPDLSSARQHILTSDTSLARIAEAGMNALNHYRQHAQQTLGKACGIDDYLTRNIRQALSKETSQLEQGMTWLATVGSISPFVGLFGTVWGIYHALTGIAAAGQVSIGTVSGPIGEALVATAAGLAAAIPAVVAYNAFLRSNRVLSQEMDGFAHDLHAQLLIEAGEN